MYIKIIKDHQDERRTYKKGKVIDVQQSFGKKLIDEKVAKEATDREYQLYKRSRSGPASQEEEVTKTDSKKSE